MKFFDWLLRRKQKEEDKEKAEDEKEKAGLQSLDARVTELEKDDAKNNPVEQPTTQAVEETKQEVKP